MGRKSNYFRHSFEAHNDDKIITLLEKGGLKGVGFYFVLLEIYGRALTDSDNENITLKIHQRRIATATGLRSDSTRTCIELLADCKLIDLVSCKSGGSYVELAIPNFLKYFGRFDKTEPIKCPNKKKVKEKKRKENNTKESVFDFEAVYNLYPRKRGKAVGLDRCKSQIKTESRYKELIQAVNNYAREQKTTDPNYILQFDTFMNKKWKDWVDPESEQSYNVLDNLELDE